MTRAANKCKTSLQLLQVCDAPLKAASHNTCIIDAECNAVLPRYVMSRTRLQYEFKLATVFWLKLLLVSNALNSFRTRQRSVTICQCFVYYYLPAQHGTRHSTIVLLPSCADSFSAGLATTVAESNSKTAHCTVRNCESKRLTIIEA